MSVRKREWITRRGEKKEAWVVDFTDGEGRRQIQTFPLKKKADAFAATVKVNINAGTHVALDNTLTVAGVADKWLKAVEAHGRERATLKQYREHVSLHIVPRIGAVRLAKLTRGHVEHFRDGLLAGDKALSRAMARKVFVSFKAMLRIVHCSHLADNVKIATPKRTLKVEAGRDFPTPAEVKRLIDAAKGKPRLSAVLKVAALTGLRASEFIGLRWSDANLKSGELHVRQRADRWGNIGAPKTDSSRRTIPIGNELTLTLKEWKIACPKGEADLVFPTSKGTVDDYRNMWRALDPIMKAAGVVTKSGEAKYAWHAFRHFFASWCINPEDRGGRELPAKIVQQWLGHSSITMTLDLYGHLFPTSTDRTEINTAEKALLG
jgi:integrase